MISNHFQAEITSQEAAISFWQVDFYMPFIYLDKKVFVALKMSFFLQVIWPKGNKDNIVL